MAETPGGLQRQITTFKKHRERSGMCMNPSVSESFRLRPITLLPAPHTWVDSGMTLMKGHIYNAALGIILGTLPTLLRQPRSTREDQKLQLLRALRPREPQPCASGLPKAKQHGRALDQAGCVFRRMDYKAEIEPHFQLTVLLGKLNLLIYQDKKHVCIV